MTYYYYLASDQQFNVTQANGSLEMIEIENLHIPGFAYEVQIEIFNGVEKDWELRELLQFIQQHVSAYETCTVQVANLLNSNRHVLRVIRKESIPFHQLLHFKQLLVEEGQLLHIEKTPIH